MTSPTEIIRRYWQFPWSFTANGDLHIRKPHRTIINKEADYAPKSQRVTG
jgi:hypothetical protein